jgi:hydroxymethylglutaryl-CoA reductase
MILKKLNLRDANVKIEVFPQVPRAMGLGGSAALAVAIIRALSEAFNLTLDEEQISDLAFASETIVHGAASGIDNTLATYGKFIRYQKGTPADLKFLHPPKPIPIVIGLTYVESLTARMVSKVEQARAKNQKIYDEIFKDIDQLVLRAEQAIADYDLELLGSLMNINQGYLNALQVSGREIEELVDIARKNGALGAKLTGGGGGGAIIALCANTAKAEQVTLAIRNAGYKAMITEIQ